MLNLTKKIKKIGIDARFYGPIGKGLGRYVKELVDGLIKIDNENEYVIFLRKENFDSFCSENKKVKKVLADFGWYSLAEQIRLPYLIWKEKIDLMHFPHFNVPIFCPKKFVVTIHDLILYYHSTQRATMLNPVLYKIKEFAYKIVINMAILRAEKIITVSNFVKKDLLKVFNIKENKIVVTYEGIAEDLLKNQNNLNDKKSLLGYNISRPYAIYVGNAYPHKNLDLLVEVFCNLDEKYDWELVLVGKEDYFYNRLKNESIKKYGSLIKKINFVGYVTDEQLGVFYKNATAYIFSSLYEGFGLPPVEAIANGLAVTTSDKGSMPEILKDGALYFDPENKNDMKEKIIKIMTDKNLRENLVEKGKIVIQDYSWNKCIIQTLSVYNNLKNV